MTARKITPDQQRIIDRLRAAEANYRAAKATLEDRLRAQLRAELAILGEDRAELIFSALHAGISKAVIAREGLGTSDRATLYRLIENAPATLRATLPAVTHTAHSTTHTPSTRATTEPSERAPRRDAVTNASEANANNPNTPLEEFALDASDGTIIVRPAPADVLPELDALGVDADNAATEARFTVKDGRIQAVTPGWTAEQGRNPVIALVQMEGGAYRGRFIEWLRERGKVA